jgi:hypothetical protein
MARILEDRESSYESLKERLDKLADVVGWQKTPVAHPGEAPKETVVDPARIDREVVFPGMPLPTLAEYVAFMKAVSAAANPMAVIASHGMTLDSYAACVSRWGQLLGASDMFALRYSQLIEAVSPACMPPQGTGSSTESQAPGRGLYAMSSARAMTPKSLFQLVDRLLALPQLKRTPVEEVTGVSLEALDENDPFFVTYHGEGSEGSDAMLVELRVPGPCANVREGLLILGVNPSLTGASESISQRYGKEWEFVPRPPAAPSDVPFYYVYRRPSVKLSFGLLEPDALVSVVIDRTGA